VHEQCEKNTIFFLSLFLDLPVFDLIFSTHCLVNEVNLIDVDDEE